MKAQQEIVTVAMAKEYLERARPNRRLHENVASRYANDMKNSRWVANGQGIIFNHNGELIDGQHRCRAIILAGVPISMLVVRGVADAAMETIDGGRARKLSDVLQIKGYKDAVVLAGAARSVYNYVAGVSMEYMPTKAALFDFITAHPHLQEAASQVSANIRVFNVPRAPFAAVMALGNASGNLSTEADAFVEGIIYGEGLYKGDARLTFRNWLSTLRSSHEYTSQSVSEPTFGALIRAWNAYASGKELQALRFPKHPSRDSIEVFGFSDLDWPDVPNLVEERERTRLANLEAGKKHQFKQGHSPQNKGKTLVVRPDEAPPAEPV